METRAQLGALPRTAIIVTILALLLALLSAIAIGQQPSPKLPAPMGPARNGLIAFDDGGDIWVVSPDGTGRKALTTGSALETSPVWSDDGTRIAYWSQQESNGPVAIKVMDANGVNIRTLIDGVTLSDMSLAVSWSHDGRYLAYTDVTDALGPGYERISIIPAAGGEPVELSPGRGPTWSPDDTFIAFRSGGPIAGSTRTEPPGVSVIGADGTGKRIVDDTYIQNPWAYMYPQWSPDGTLLAYHGGINDGAQIQVAAADGSGIEAITHKPSGGVWPMWSPDGSRIAYLGPSAAQGRYQVDFVNPDGTGARTVDHPPLGCNCIAEWSPDGTKMVAYQDGPVVGHEDTGGSLMVVDVDGAVPVLSIPITGVMGQMSWQRLAP